MIDAISIHLLIKTLTRARVETKKSFTKNCTLEVECVCGPRVWCAFAVCVYGARVRCACTVRVYGAHAPGTPPS